MQTASDQEVRRARSTGSGVLSASRKPANCRPFGERAATMPAAARSAGTRGRTRSCPSGQPACTRSSDTAHVSRPVIGVGFHPLVVRVERRLEQQDGGDAAGHLGDVTRLFGLEVTPEQGALAVGEPLLHHLVAADRVLPDAGGDAAPVGDVAQVDVVAGAAEAGGELVVGEAEISEALAEGGELGVGVGALDDAAAAGPSDAALAAVAPAGGDGEVAGGGVELASGDRGEHADRAQLVAHGAGGDCVDRLLDVEQRRDLAAELGGGEEGVAGGGERDAGPVLAEGAGVLVAIPWTMKGGNS